VRELPELFALHIVFFGKYDQVFVRHPDVEIVVEVVVIEAAVIEVVVIEVVVIEVVVIEVDVIEVDRRRPRRLSG